MDINRYHIKSPTEIVTTTLGIPEDYKQQCIQEAYKIGDQQGKKTNVKAIMSSYAVWEETDVYNGILEKVSHEIRDKLISIKDKRWTYILIEAWIAIYKEGHYTTSHDHVPSQISFVYYLKANGNSSPLIFDGCEFQVNPYDDLLVVFPSHLIHSVPEHYGEDRICIAGNLSLAPK
jgi:hypothetical protein